MRRLVCGKKCSHPDLYPWILATAVQITGGRRLRASRRPHGRGNAPCAFGGAQSRIPRGRGPPDVPAMTLRILRMAADVSERFAKKAGTLPPISVSDT